MIVSFGAKETQKIWNGEVSGKYRREIQEVARRKFRMPNNSVDTSDLRIPPVHQPY